MAEQRYGAGGLTQFNEVKGFNFPTVVFEIKESIVVVCFCEHPSSVVLNSENFNAKFSDIFNENLSCGRVTERMISIIVESIYIPN